MALDFNTIKDDMALAIANAMAAASQDQMAALPILGLGVDSTWDGTATVLTPDTTQIKVDNFIKQNAIGNWYKVASVIPSTSIVVLDFYTIGSFPSGGSPIALSATYTWDGTNTVLTTDTSEVVAGDSIRLDSDGQFFVVLDVVANTSVLVGDGGLVVPTGATVSSKAGTSRTTKTLPTPPDGASLVETAGEPIAFPVVDEGLLVEAGAPREFLNVTVAGLSGLTSPATGSMVFVTNASGGSIPAFFDGTNWRRVDTRAIVT